MSGTIDNQPDLNDMALFVRIVETGSISAGGRALGLPKATASRRLAELEARIGAPLLRRSTRSLSVTDFGRRYYARIFPIVRDAEQAQAEAIAEHGRPIGLVRVSAPVAYGQKVLAPKFFGLLGANPGLSLDVRLDDSKVNLVAEGFDLVIRSGRLDDSDLLCRHIATVERFLVAAPDYLLAHGTPTDIPGLQNLRAVVTRPDLDHWILGGEIVRMAWCLSTGSMPFTMDAVRAGLGVGLIPDFIIGADLASGRLVRVLPDIPAESTDLTVLYARTATGSPAVRAVLAAIVAE